MSTIRSLTAALALALAAPFAGAHAADGCAETAADKSASKAAKTHDAATKAKQPVQAKMGKPQVTIPPSGEKTAWSKAFQKQKGHCC